MGGWLDIVEPVLERLPTSVEDPLTRTHGLTLKTSLKLIKQFGHITTFRLTRQDLSATFPYCLAMALFHRCDVNLYQCRQ